MHLKDHLHPPAQGAVGGWGALPAGGGAGLRSVLKEIEARGGVTLTTVKRVMEVAPEPAEPVLTSAWPEDMDPDNFAALHVGPLTRSET